ncbi:MAG: hypothetical protein WAM28_00430 [Chlamydiales bacterium]
MKIKIKERKSDTIKESRVRQDMKLMIITIDIILIVEASGTNIWIKMEIPFIKMMMLRIYIHNRSQLAMALIERQSQQTELGSQNNETVA